MTQQQLSGAPLKHRAKQATREAAPWIEPLGRFGYAAKGIVYGLVGVLAVQAATGAGGQTTDARGALGQIAQAPFGRFLLVATAIGLAGYAIWRLVQAFMDTENKGSEAKGYLMRIGYGIVGLIYIGLAFSAVQLALGNGGDGGDATQDWTTRLMAQPFGRALVGLAGAVVIGVGLYHLYRAYSAKFREKLKLGEMSPTEEIWATRAGRLGYAARGIVFGIIGGFLIIAALRARPEEARGLGGALQTLADQPWGPILLGIVALGLVAYGVYCLVEARYRRMVIW